MTVELETLSSCPLCGSDAIRDWREAEDRVHGRSPQRYVYARCHACGIAFLRLRPTEATAADLYSEDYEPYADVEPMRSYPPAERLDAVFSRGPGDWKGLVAAAYRPPRAGARLLDFGCGSPRFARWAAAQGWAVTGADFSPAVVAAVRAAGFEAHHVDELRAHPPDGTFDLVRMNHVLEHLYDPVATLERTHGMLQPGAVLHVAVPNPAGLTSTLFRSAWAGLEPRHVMLFGPAQLASLIEQAGFRGVQVRHEPAPRDVFRSLDHVAENSQHPTVRRLLDGWAARRGWQIVAHTAALAGRGGRLHALARA